MLGKSVKRCDSKRVDLLALVAKSVTGQVRWQVTGRKATLRTCRVSAKPADSGFARPACQGRKRSNPTTARKTANPSAQRMIDDRNMKPSLTRGQALSLFRR